MRVAVVGAGFSGLVAARVLVEVGFDVVVYEKDADVGGVWSASRHYPGLSTQNDKMTYAYSELAMPSSYPEFPAGPQIRKYLESYVDRFALAPLLHLGSEVTSADPGSSGGWSLTVTGSDGCVLVDRVDHLVVANGVYSQPRRPFWSGRGAYEAAGGTVVTATDLHDADVVRDRAVVVIGDGKTASDIAVALSEAAASTTVIARELRWKVPKLIAGRVRYQNLLLTRLGENLFRAHRLRGAERFLHGIGNPVRRRLLDGMRGVIARQLGLRQLGLVPASEFSDVASARAALVTDGFYPRVAEGSIRVLRDRSVVGLSAVQGHPTAVLSDGTTVSADVIVVAAGHDQQIPFLPAAVQAELVDDSGDFRLYRNVLPVTVADLTVLGYNQSFFSPLSAEMAAIWVASLLTGQHRLPPVADQEAEISQRLAWSRERTRGAHSSGANITPFSLHNIDDLLDDIGLNVGPAVRARQWLLPVDPAAYRYTLAALVARLPGMSSSVTSQPGAATRG